MDIKMFLKTSGKRLLFQLCVSTGLLLTSSALFAGLEQVPDEFLVKEKVMIDLTDSHGSFAIVRRELLSWLPHYELIDRDGHVVARASMKNNWVTSSFEVTDSASIPLGCIEKKFSFFTNNYAILSPTEHILADAKGNFWGTRCTITDPTNGQELASLSCPFFGANRPWKVCIKDQNAINDKKLVPLLLFLAACKADGHRAESEQYWKDRARYWESMYWHEVSRRESNLYSKSAPQESLSMTQSESEQRLHDWAKKLETFKLDLYGIDPSQEDFHVVELLLAPFSTTDLENGDRFDSDMSKLFDLFSSKELTQGQKAALFILLDHSVRG